MSNKKISIVTLNERIAIIRKHKALSQKEFALALNVSRSYISEVENNNKKPSIEMLMGINGHFSDINPDWLLAGKGEMYRDKKPAQPPFRDRDLNVIVNNYNKLSDEERRDLLRKSQELVRIQEMTTILAKLGMDMDGTAFV